MQIRHGHRVGYYFMEEVEQSEWFQKIPNHHPKLKIKQHRVWLAHQFSHIPGSNIFFEIGNWPWFLVAVTTGLVIKRTKESCNITALRLLKILPTCWHWVKLHAPLQFKVISIINNLFHPLNILSKNNTCILMLIDAIMCISPCFYFVYLVLWKFE